MKQAGGYFFHTRSPEVHSWLCSLATSGPASQRFPGSSPCVCLMDAMWLPQVQMSHLLSREGEGTLPALPISPDHEHTHSKGPCGRFPLRSTWSERVTWLPLAAREDGGQAQGLHVRLNPVVICHLGARRIATPNETRARGSQQTKRRPSELVSRVCPALPSPLPGPGPHRLSAEVPQGLPGRHFGPSLSAQPPEPARDRRGHSVCSHPLPKPRVASRGL